MRENLTIGFIGNPNCGKTTLFNAYTGANLKVANWPGVTVEKVEGAIKDHDLNIRLVDLPGTYSLTSYTMEEQVSRQFILSDEVDVIIDVADASALERNLYLTLQLLELGKPVVLALNMMDIVEKRGMEIDTHRLPEMLGIPVIPVSARKRTGLDVLLHAAAHHKDCKDPECLIHHHKYTPKHRHDHHSEYFMLKVQELLLFLCMVDVNKEKQRELYTSPQVEIVRDIHKRLISNLQERPTIEELSKEYLINTATLKDTFKGVYGQPIGTYMKVYRMKQAAALLRQTQATIAEIASQVGYENQSKFATAFRDVMKIAPAEYRKQNSGD